MLKGKGMVNFSEGHFLKVVVVGHWGMCDIFQVFRRVNRYHSIETVYLWGSLDYLESKSSQ